MSLQHVLERARHLVGSVRWNTQTIALLLLACLALIGILAIQQPLADSAHVALFDGRRMTPSDLQRIEAALGKTDLEQCVVRNGQICVPSQQRGKYLAVLEEANALPESFHSPTAAALNAGGAFETSLKSKQRMHHALEQKARFAICQLRGVEDAFVYFDEKADRLSLRQKQQTTAVVGVHTSSAHQPLDLQTLKAIREMLLGFKANLTKEDITVTDLGTGESYRGSLAESGASYQTLARKGLEREWKERVVAALAFVPEAQVNVRVDPASNAMEAQAVSVSIGIPSTYVARIRPDAASAQQEIVVSDLRKKIQSTVLPLLPTVADGLSKHEPVTVNVFDVVADERTGFAHSRISTSLLTLGLIIAFLISGAFLFLSLGQPREPAEVSQLRVYTSTHDEPSPQEHPQHVADEEPQGSATKLRAFVEEDPAAAAQSLSDFIDRAS